MKTYIYFLHDQTTGYVKVGSSTAPLERMANVKYDGNKEYLYHTFKPLYIAEIKDRTVEEKAHFLLRKEWIRREWFNISERHILALAKILRLKLEKINN